MRVRSTKAYKAGRDHYVRFGYREAPLSGEWAGESARELSGLYGIDLEDPDNADHFEQGFFEEAGEDTGE